MYGDQVGVAVYDEAHGTAISIRGEVNVGITSIRDLDKMGKLEWGASLFVGVAWTRGHDEDSVYRDFTFPSAWGSTRAFRRPSPEPSTSLQLPRGDESPVDGSHELLLSIGFHSAPPLEYKSKN